MFRIWDKVKYINGSQTYEVIHIATSHMIIRGSRWAYATSWDKLVKIDADVPDDTTIKLPDYSNNNPINSMQYFHTAVLIKCDPSFATCSSANYEELVPYAVRVAKDSGDMRDTLVRELKKGVATSDCKFLITPIF